MRQYAAALEGVKAQAANIGAERTKPGSFNALCLSYYRSPEFRGLETSTQAVRRNIIERFRNEHGDKPVSRLGRAHIKDIIGAKANTPEAANNLLKVLRVLLDHAVSIEMIASNPAVGVKRYKSSARSISPRGPRGSREPQNSRSVLGGRPGVRPSIGVRFRGAADIGRRSGRARNLSF